MWTYNQSTGNLSLNDQFVGTGYSGFGEAKNQTSCEDQVDIGPIPRGAWKIEFPPFNTVSHGPLVFRLDPDDDAEIFGRSGFLIHGDSIEAPGTASHGCIIMAHSIRLQIAASLDQYLEVVSSDVPDAGVLGS